MLKHREDTEYDLQFKSFISVLMLAVKNNPEYDSLSPEEQGIFHQQVADELLKQPQYQLLID